MKQAKARLYIRFGEIPQDSISKVHRGDDIIREEGGISVWRAIKVDGTYYPMLPKHPNNNTINDYFYMLLNKNVKAYLVTGNEIFIEGADREPLLRNVTIISELHFHH